MAAEEYHNQTISMLKWFFDQDVTAVDIHLRCPKVKGARYHCEEEWLWLTTHQNLKIEAAIKIVKWCRYKNSQGSDIFIRPHRHDKQPMIFLDDLPIAKAMMVAKKYCAQIIETSTNNTQVWIALSKPLSESDRKVLQQHISKLGFSDKGSVSGEHFGRLCGYKSQKRRFWVRRIDTSTSKKYNPPELTACALPQGGACARNNSHQKSQSEIDFSWVLSHARKGAPSEMLISTLTESAMKRGKSAPRKYAERTVRRAIDLLT
jgi:hypothetical protein